MGLLLDTHIVIWLSTEPDQIPATVRQAILDADQRYISAISFFEVAIKHRKDPEAFPFSFKLMETARKDLQALELPLRRKHLVHLERIPVLHKDPFDHLLMSQAIGEQLTLVSMDAAFSNYGVEGLAILSY